jgi:hypothetical protein
MRHLKEQQSRKLPLARTRRITINTSDGKEQCPESCFRLAGPDPRRVTGPDASMVPSIPTASLLPHAFANDYDHPVRNQWIVRVDPDDGVGAPCHHRSERLQQHRGDDQRSARRQYPRVRTSSPGRATNSSLTMSRVINPFAVASRMAMHVSVAWIGSLPIRGGSPRALESHTNNRVELGNANVRLHGTP